MSYNFEIVFLSSNLIFFKFKIWLFFPKYGLQSPIFFSYTLPPYLLKNYNVTLSSTKVSRLTLMLFSLLHQHPPLLKPSRRRILPSLAPTSLLFGIKLNQNWARDLALFWSDSCQCQCRHNREEGGLFLSH